MSASERADPELYELIRNRFVRCSNANLDGGLSMWGVTEWEKRVPDRQAMGEY
jgi:hypothetical protein